MMDGKELATKINKEIAEAGYRQEIFAIGPSDIPILLKSLVLRDGSITIPPGFRVMASLVSNDQSNSIGAIHQKQRAASDGPDPE